MEISALPLLDDNYGWLLRSGDRAWVIDPSEAAPVLARLHHDGLTLEGVLLTHHHADHVGGVPGLLEAMGPLPVLCSAGDLGRIPGASRGVTDGEALRVLGAEVRALHVPGHTTGALAWHLPALGRVFTGDTLFMGGCGRLFEGSPAQMVASLDRLRSLPPETLVCCGHEYTVRNLEFAQSLEPDHAGVARRLEEARAHRARGMPTVPAPLALERATNPFLRFDDPSLRRCTGTEDDVACFAAMRARKDRFQPPG